MTEPNGVVHPAVSGREHCTPVACDRTPGAHHDDGRQDLSALRSAAESTELTAAVNGLTDAYGYRLSASHTLWPLARDIARALVEAGFTLHHCGRSHPLYRLGGVCLIPIDARHGDGDETGVAVSWTTHDLLALDWDRWAVYHGAHTAMNDTLVEVLRVLGFAVRPFGSGGASLVTGRRTQNEETGR
jgi:hypothetical protein